MFGWLKKDPVKKIEDEIAKKYAQSVQLQRDGKLEEYGRLTKEIEGLESQLQELRT